MGARNELQAALSELDHEKIQREVAKDSCDWIEFKFNTPHASHMGGVWERIIRSVRTVLSSNTGDIEEALSPTQLLTLKSKVMLPPPRNVMKKDVYSRKRWKRVQLLANQLWCRWRKEYLPTLQSHSKWTKLKCW